MCHGARFRNSSDALDKLGYIRHYYRHWFTVCRKGKLVNKLRLLSVHVPTLGVVSDNLSLGHTETQIELPVAAVDKCGWTDRHYEAKKRLSRLGERA